MTIQDCANETGKSWQTIRRWIEKYNIDYSKNSITRDISIDKKSWDKFCIDKNIERAK